MHTPVLTRGVKKMLRKVTPVLKEFIVLMRRQYQILQYKYIMYMCFVPTQTLINTLHLYGISQFIKHFSHIISFQLHGFFTELYIFFILELRGPVSTRLNNLTKSIQLKREITKTGTQSFTG